jgi:geranylgeranyl pyrophosphate synthase
MKALSVATGEAPRGQTECRRVPGERSLRELLRRQAEQVAGRLSPGQWLSRRKLEELARGMLWELGLPLDYLGWTMVAIASAYWRPEVAAVPYHRRLVLLPHCMRDPVHCQGYYTAEGLVCRECGACPLGQLVQESRKLGCTVLLAEGSPVVARQIMEGVADAVLGVACLDSLEKVFDRLVAAGLPAMAVPLVVGGCRHTHSDEDWIWEMIHTPYMGQASSWRTFVHLLRAVRNLFRWEQLQALLADCPGGVGVGSLDPSPLDGKPLAALEPDRSTARIAWDFVRKGGKYFRPLLMLAAYDASTGGEALGPGGQEVVRRWPKAVWRVAVAIELFHKASLVHDDIEDQDQDRYGAPALHVRFGVPAALNVGDYLLGQGYALIAALAGEVAPAVAGEILASFTRAHVQLCEGQGAELAWRERVEEFADPAVALRIYALKTAPALEAALFAGLRLAGPLLFDRELLSRLCRHLGVAYQIQNDLDDWSASGVLARSPGGDGARLRPTLLWALAARATGPELTRQLVARWRAEPDPRQVRIQVYQWFEDNGVFGDATRLREKYRERFRELADQVPSGQWREVLLRIEELVLG